MGEKINTLVEEKQVSGEHTINWDGRDNRGRAVASGMYILELRSGRLKQSRRMILLK
jgi:flagellar hook assembly protein FlgD